MDTTTSYLGLTLRHPLVASAGPLSQSVDQVKALADTGLGAVVLYSLFAEQVQRQAERDLALEEDYAESFAEATSYFPSVDELANPAAGYLSLIERSAAAVDVPIIASLNASALGSWTSFAQQLVDAGASALECNIYLVPGDLSMTGAQVEAQHLEIVAAVKQAVDVPVAVKLSPYFSSPGNFALQVIEAGADGLVLFNRFLQPGVDVEQLAVVSGVHLSSPADARVPRTWIAALRRQTKASLAASSGVESSADAIAHLLAGADVVMTTSALVRHGAGYAAKLIAGMDDWAQSKGYTSVDEFRGLLAVPSDADPLGYHRSGYLAALEKAKSMYGSLRH